MSQITEAKLYEAFGLGEKAQAVAEPATPAEPQAAEPAEGAQEQEPAEPAAVEAGTPNVNAEPNAVSGAPEDPANHAAEGMENPTKTQTPEERRANAARRRQQEQQAAVDSAVAAERQQAEQRQADVLKEVFAKAGLVNTVTGKPITTLDEFNTWNQEFAQIKLEQDLKEGRLSKEALEQLISNHPAVKQAEAAVSQLNRVQEEQQQAEAKARIDSQLAEIGKLNPQIKELGDILQMPTAEQFRENVNKGMNFLDAYKLANMDAIAEGKAQRAIQAAQSNNRGKEHLVATGNSRGSGAASVPPDQMRLYRMMNPKATDAQIQAHFNQYLTNQGG